MPWLMATATCVASQMVCARPRLPRRSPDAASPALAQVPEFERPVRGRRCIAPVGSGRGTWVATSGAALPARVHAPRAGAEREQQQQASRDRQVFHGHQLLNHLLLGRHRPEAVEQHTRQQCERRQNQSRDAGAAADDDRDVNPPAMLTLSGRISAWKCDPGNLPRICGREWGAVRGNGRQDPAATFR